MKGYVEKKNNLARLQLSYLQREDKSWRITKPGLSAAKSNLHKGHE